MGFSTYLLFLPQLGLPELSIIFVLVLILFGPGKLPGVMKSLGDGVRQFKDAAGGMSGDNPAIEKTGGKAETAEKPE